MRDLLRAGCAGDGVSVMRYKPTIPEISPWIAALYARHSAGCCLHIVLDDGNTEDDSVEWCIGHAIKNECYQCTVIGFVLRVMSRTQRGKLSRTQWVRWE